MKRHLTIKFFLISSLLISFVAVPISCSEDDSANAVPVADPTNINTTIKATTPQEANSTLSSTITVQLAESNGNLMTISGGTVLLTSTGSAILSAITDNNNGTYTATITSSKEETVVIYGTLNGIEITNIIAIIFNPDNSNPAKEIPQSLTPVGPSILRINSGGPRVIYDDIEFQADEYYEGLTVAYTNSFVTEIADTTMDEIYLTERITDITRPLEPFSYAIPITNGTYTVKLYFAEIFWGSSNREMLVGGVGSRIFSCEIEGTEVFSSYDLFKEVGAARAITRMYDIEVADGVLNIKFQAAKDRPKVSAIEIFGNGTIGL